MYKKLILTGLIVVSLLSGCVEKKKSTEIPAIPVRTTIVDLDKNENEYEYVGIIEEERSSAISFTVAGTVKTMYGEEGQRVKKGELLAELDTANLSSAYAAAKAQLSQAEDAMQRIQQLYDNQSIPEIKYIDVQTQLEKARSTEAIAKKNLMDSRLIAPFDGIIGKKSTESGENVLPNQPVYTLLKIDDIKVKVSIPEKEIADILQNQRAQIRIPALKDALYDGIIEERGIVADPVSHSYTVRIRVHNPATKMLPGMVCKVSVFAESTRHAMFVISSQCVQTLADKRFVWCIVDGQAVRLYVKTGKFTPNGVEILSGLQGGEEIVVEGYQSLYEGATLKIL